MKRENNTIARRSRVSTRLLVLFLACILIFYGNPSFSWEETQERASYFPSAEQKIHVAQSSGQIGQSKGKRKKQSSTFSTRKPDSCSEWAFGTGSSQKLEKAGIDGKTLEKKISSKKKKKEEEIFLPAKPRTARELRALRLARERRLRAEERGSGMELKVDRLEQNWTRRNDIEIDEEVPLEGHHRVRALAGVREDSVSFGVGPEVILRDKNQIHSTLKKKHQPEVNAGVGLQINVDF